MPGPHKLLTANAIKQRLTSMECEAIAERFVDAMALPASARRNQRLSELDQDIRAWTERARTPGWVSKSEFRTGS